MRILLAAAPVIHREQAFNLQTILEYMKTYCERAELIVFGEAVLQGFDSLCWHYEEDRTVAVALTDASIVKIRAAAKRRHIAVSFGMIERRSGSLYSTQLFIGADGEIVNVFHRVSPGWKDRSQTAITARARASKSFPTAERPSPSACAATSGQKAGRKK